VFQLSVLDATEEPRFSKRKISVMPECTVAVDAAIDLEQALADLLQELSIVQEEVLGVLSEKRERMANRDVEGMTALQAREEEVSRRLAQCHERRQALLKQAAESGYEADSIDSLARRLPLNDPAEVRRQVRHSSTRMRVLQHQSLANWVLAQQSLLHLSQMFEILANGGRLKPTYEKSDPSFSGGSLVDREI
jgi:hypothetical protein